MKKLVLTHIEFGALSRGMMVLLKRLGFAIAFGLLLLTAPVSAHDMNMTGVRVTLGSENVQVSVLTHLHQLKTDAPAEAIVKRLKLRLDGKPFVPDTAQLTRDSANSIVIWQATRRGKASWVGLDSPLFPEKTDQATTLSVIKNRQVWKEAILDSAHPSATVGYEAPEPSRMAVLTGFLRQGILHIFLGPDHVLFLISLLLLGGNWKRLLKIVTAFTLAHSITLSLAATGTFLLPPRFVEPVIALSIIAIALTNIKNSALQNMALPDEKAATTQRDFRPWMAFGFGLIHGFGFAAAVTEVGLPREALGLALFGFNAGVEMGQATIVLLVCPTLAILVSLLPKLQLPLVRYGSASVAAVGAFWFVQRILNV